MRGSHKSTAAVGLRAVSFPAELHIELERLAQGDNRPVIDSDGGTTQMTLPSGETQTVRVSNSVIDEERLKRLEELQQMGLVAKDPMRWHPASYHLTPEGKKN